MSKLRPVAIMSGIAGVSAAGLEHLKDYILHTPQSTSIKQLGYDVIVGVGAALIVAIMKSQSGQTPKAGPTG